MLRLRNHRHSKPPRTVGRALSAIRWLSQVACGYEYTTVGATGATRRSSQADGGQATDETEEQTSTAGKISSGRLSNGNVSTPLQCGELLLNSTPSVPLPKPLLKFLQHTSDPPLQSRPPLLLHPNRVLLSLLRSIELLVDVVPLLLAVRIPCWPARRRPRHALRPSGWRVRRLEPAVRSGRARRAPVHRHR